MVRGLPVCERRASAPIFVCQQRLFSRIAWLIVVLDILTHVAGSPRRSLSDLTDGASSSVSSTFHPCKHEEYQLVFDHIRVFPDPILTGQSVTVELGGSNTGLAVTSGKITIAVILDRVLPFYVELPLCSTLSTGCPIPSGPFTTSVQAFLPADTPNGNIAGKIKMVTGEHELACYDVHTRIQRPGVGDEQDRQTEHLLVG
ncbi:unnamed protein product [Vitrella brassicaformis CCMP3155]|uniref:MD-2-related lipid-recognition domain-containing protein n=2 Tax=Vitrella brassicaformis TaxID=1169539 RepID=A0A0G4ELJ9_VITBC|nr:unnamed protein product [Vitrella brassicaformis CCMP3155]|eukprot:CEL97698.1 unnamed protein product [Vitrella brassicaformis CCMP3155]